MTRSLTLTKLQGVCKTLFDKSNKKQARPVDLVALFLTVFMFATWATAHPERFHLEMMQPGCNGYQDLRDLLRGIDSLYNYIQHLSGIEGYSMPNLVFSKDDATQAYHAHDQSRTGGPMRIIPSHGRYRSPTGGPMRIVPVHRRMQFAQERTACVKHGCRGCN